MNSCESKLVKLLMQMLQGGKAWQIPALGAGGMAPTAASHKSELLHGHINKAARWSAWRALMTSLLRDLPHVCGICLRVLACKARPLQRLQRQLYTLCVDAHAARLESLALGEGVMTLTVQGTQSSGGFRESSTAMKVPPLDTARERGISAHRILWRILLYILPQACLFGSVKAVHTQHNAGKKMCN